MKDYKLLPNGRWVKVRDDQDKDFCEVCGDTDVRLEHHHWAPKHLFGEYADIWPTSRLCDLCHRFWHKVVTPNMGKP